MYTYFSHPAKLQKTYDAAKLQKLQKMYDAVGSRNTPAYTTIAAFTTTTLALL
jgi:hypothetical protein